MFQVQIVQLDAAQEKLLTEFIVGSDGLRLVGSEGEEIFKQVTEISVIDPDEHKKVTATSDPLRWAELLPLAFRHGGLRADVRDIGERADIGEPLHLEESPAMSPAMAMAFTTDRSFGR